MKKLFTKLVAKLFGLRLPCGHGRIKARIGSLYSCNVCGRTYRLCIFISPKE